MNEVHALVHSRKGYLVRLYTIGWDANLAGWTEELSDLFAQICSWAGDDASQCSMVGEAKWVWLRFGKTNKATIREIEFPGSVQVTMIRVHRTKKKRGDV
jgi:hypothetical protein